MPTSTHLYTNNEANKVHDDIISTIVQSFARHTISYPDRDNPDAKNPDISIDNRLFIEVKVLNPTHEDWQADQSAVIQFDDNGFTTGGGKLNPKPIQDAVYNANKQLSGLEGYRLLVLFSPMAWQFKPSVINYMLSGLVTFEYNPSDGSLNRTTNKVVPLKRTIDCIDGIIYLYADMTGDRVVWMLNNKTCDLLDSLSVRSVNFWDSVNK